MLKSMISMLASTRLTSMRGQGRFNFLVIAFALALLPITSFAGSLNFDCEPVQIIERSNRVGVKCLNPYPGGIDALAIEWIYFVTFPKTDQAQMERFLNFATTAMVEDKYFKVDVPATGEDNINGCLEENCRTVTTPFAIENK